MQECQAAGTTPGLDYYAQYRHTGAVRHPWLREGDILARYDGTGGLEAKFNCPAIEERS